MIAIRWTVIRQLAPERRGNERRTRALVRCVCGVEQIMWLHDIQRGLSTGCRSRRCRTRHEVAQEIRKASKGLRTVADVMAFVDRWVAEGRQRDEERAMAALDAEIQRAR